MILTFGEALVRLTPPRNLRMEQTPTFEVEVGGAELNTGVGLARLGHAVAWISVVPASPLGTMIRARVRAADVDDRFVITRDGRAGLYFLEEGATPRAASIVYDRAGSCMANLAASDFDWPTILAGANWFHVTGITAALSETTLTVVLQSLRAAKAIGIRTSFDLNYRSKLWSIAAASGAFTTLLPHVDVLIASENDAKQFFGIEGDFATAASKMCERFGNSTVATMQRDARGLRTDRVWGVGYHAGHVHETQAFDVEVVDRIGTGDAFTAGVIDGVIRGAFEDGLDTAAAMGALAHTIRGDLPLLSRAEIESAKAGDGLRIRR